MTINYFENGARLAVSSVNALTAARSYTYAPGMAGWFSNYQLSGAAIAMPLKGGHVIALLNDEAGTEITYSQGKKIASEFGRDWPLDKKWIDAWNQLALSNAKAWVSDSVYTFPELLLIPAGGTLADATIVSKVQVADLGIRIEDITITITRDPVTSTPTLFGTLGCTDNVDPKRAPPVIADGSVSCKSLVLREF